MNNSFFKAFDEYVCNLISYLTAVLSNYFSIYDQISKEIIFDFYVIIPLMKRWTLCESDWQAYYPRNNVIPFS